MFSDSVCAYFFIYLLPLLESNARYPFNLNPVDSIPSSANDCLHGPSG